MTSETDYQAMQDRCNRSKGKLKGFPAGLTASQKALQDALGASQSDERDIHDQIAAELRRRRWYFVHSRTDKKTTQNVGVTDFICALPNGVTLWIEVKRKNGKLSPSQYATMHVLKALGHFHTVVYSFSGFLNYLDDYARIERTDG